MPLFPNRTQPRSPLPRVPRSSSPASAEALLVDGMERREHEPRKLFVGGLPRWGITQAHLRAHFARYGEVVEALVILFPDGFGRGFGFVEFVDDAAVLRALEQSQTDEHNNFFGRKVEVKRASKKPETRSVQTQAIMYNPNAEARKIFVGGLRDHLTREHVVGYFKKFGAIMDAVVMYDKVTKKPRGFGFVTFESQEATDTVLQNRFHYLNGTKVEVKNAEPRGRNHSPANRYDEVYSAYNMPYFLPNPYMYPYPYMPYPYLPHAIHPMNQISTFDAMTSGSDSKLSHVNGNQSRVRIHSPIGTKHDPMKPSQIHQKVGIPSSNGAESDPTKPSQIPTTNSEEEANCGRED